MINSDFYIRAKTSLILGLMAVCLFAFFPPILIDIVLVACVSWILLDEWPKIAAHMGFSGWVLAFIYLILPFQALIQLNRTNQQALIIMCILVASCDIGCYIFGSLFGKLLLAPSISPKKSWEGLFGGIFSTIIALYALHYLLGRPLPLLYCIPVGSATALLAIAGDLFESFLKRTANLKDAGSVLPGHGGLLDRFDSLIFVASFYYYFVA